MKHLDLNEINSLNKRKIPSDGNKVVQPIHSLTHSENPVDIPLGDNKKLAANKE